MKIYDPIGFSSKLTGSFSGSFIGDGSEVTGVISSSYAVTASYADNFTADSITASAISAEYIDFDLTPSVEPQEGRLVWNTDEGTLDLGLNQVTLQLGQEMYWYVRNNTTSSIPDGTPVMATGTLGASARITVAPMVADGSIPAKYFLGVSTEEIAADSDGYVTTFGKVRNYDTSLIPSGSILWCDPSTPGGLTTTEPTAPSLKLPVAFTLNEKINGAIAVRATTGVRLENSHDVQVTSASYGELLMSSGSIWINSSQLSGSYGITGSLSTDGNVTIGGWVDIDDDLNVDGGDLTTNQTTFNLLNSNATTVNAFGASTAINMGTGGAGGGETIIGHDLTVTGDLTAQSLHVQLITSSIVYSSGSNIFGSQLSDTHQFTGSVSITGSSTFTNNGPAYFLQGNVGIGTNDPSARFHSQVSSETTIGIFENTAGKSFNVLTDANRVYLSEGTSSTTNSLIINGTDNQFEFRTSGSERMRIDSSGDIGIGTNDPSNTYSGLTIYGSNPSLALETSNASGWVWTQYINSSGTNNFSMGVNQTQPHWAVKAGAGMDSPDLVVDANGNVGIGTTTPNTALQVSQASLAPLLIHRPNNTNFDPHGIVFSTRNDSNNGGLGDARAGIFYDYNGDLFLAANTSGIVATDPTGSSRIYIDGGSGNIGIGTNNPSYHLHVEDLSNNYPTVAIISNNEDKSILRMHTNSNEGVILESDDSSTTNFYIKDANGNIKVTLDRVSGNFGIGTTGPKSKLDVEGVLTIGGSSNSGTNGAVAIQDDYDGDNHLANIGWLRSSGGPYLGYGVKQDDSADWKSTYGNFTGSRAYAKLDEDSFALASAPASATPVDTVIPMTGSFHFNIAQGQLAINRATQSGTGRLVVEGAQYHPTGSGQSREGIDIKTSTNPGSGNYGGAISIGANGSGRAAIASVQGSADSDNQGLAFFTHGSTGATDAVERMQIDSNGNIGIGTNDPNEMLHIYGAGNGKGIKIEATDGQLESAVLKLYPKSTGAGERNWAISAYRNDSDDLSFSSGNAKGDDPYTSGTTRMLIEGISGNVGINNTSPGAKLDVSGTVGQNGFYTYRKNYGSIDTTGIAVAGLNTGGNGSSAMFMFHCYGGNGGYQRIVYNCRNVSGTWSIVKTIDEGSNNLDVTASNGTTVTFTFKGRTASQSYSPAVVIHTTGANINTSYFS